LTKRGSTGGLAKETLIVRIPGKGNRKNIFDRAVELNITPLLLREPGVSAEVIWGDAAVDHGQPYCIEDIVTKRGRFSEVWAPEVLLWLFGKLHSSGETFNSVFELFSML